MVSEMRSPEVAVAVSPRFGPSKTAKSDEKWAWHTPGTFGNIDVCLEVTARAVFWKVGQSSPNWPKVQGPPLTPRLQTRPLSVA
jgi:hypothetical protein